MNFNTAPAPPAVLAPTPWWHLYVPKIYTVLREGYRPRDFRDDATAALTVAIVAIPLSMALAIASGTTPDKGLITVVVAGLVISLLSGSRYQVGGPAARSSSSSPASSPPMVMTGWSSPRSWPGPSWSARASPGWGAGSNTSRSPSSRDSHPGLR